MNVLLVNMSLDPVTGGGTAERTFQVGRHLSKKKVSCSILTADIGLTPDRVETLKGVNLIKLPCLSKRYYIPKVSFNRLNQIISNVDIVHLTNHWTLINALVHRVCKKLNKPYVVCPAGALPIYGRSRTIKTIYNRVVGNRIIRDADGHIAISVNEVDQFCAYGVGKKRISIIPNGIDPEDFQTDGASAFRRKYGLGNHPFILFMGRLNPIKGPDLLLRAFCNEKDVLSGFHLVFAGPDDGMMVQLKEMTYQFEAQDRVHFTGYLASVDKSQGYHAAHLLVIPSRQEAMSIVVLEAGITGTPALITDRCGFDQITDSGGGRVVKASVDGIQGGLLHMLSDTVRLKRMGENLKKYVAEYFTWNAAIINYLTLFNKIIESK